MTSLCRSTGRTAQNENHRRRAYGHVWRGSGSKLDNFSAAPPPGWPNLGRSRGMDGYQGDFPAGAVRG